MEKETVDITLGGEVYRLRYDLNALVVLEEAFGVSALALFDRLFGLTDEDRAALKKGTMAAADFAKKIRVADLRTLVWAGVLHEHSQMTREEVGAMITLDGLPDIVTQAIAALSASFRASTPEGQKKEPGAKPTPRIPSSKTR